MAISFTEQNQKIWNALASFFVNPYGAAALMGNLFAESSLDPCCITGANVKTREQKDAYLAAIRNKTMSLTDFSRDGVAFGLVQWRYWTRKENLMTYAKEHNSTADDLYTQLNFLASEIKTYKTVYEAIKTGTNIRDISDVIMERYEKPGTMTEAAKKKRAEFGQECFDIFAIDYVPAGWTKYVLTKLPKVNLRSGNGMDYGTVVQAKRANEKYQWVATAENGWHAIVVNVSGKDRVLWISPTYSELKRSG